MLRREEELPETERNGQICLNFLYEGGSQGEGHSQEEEGQDTAGLFLGGGWAGTCPHSLPKRPPDRPRTRGVLLPSPKPPRPSPSFSAAYRPGCDMVDQYGRDIKPAGCLPAFASLSPLALLPFPGAAPRPPTPRYPLPTPQRGQPPPLSPPPTAGELREAESLDSQEGGEYGSGQGIDGDGGPTGREGDW